MVDDAQHGTKVGSVRSSWLIARILDRTKYIDYVLACAIGALPLLAAAKYRVLFEIKDTTSTPTYDGYLTTWNESSLAILLPLLLFAFRAVLGKVIPVGPQWPTTPHPPIVDLVRGDEPKAIVYNALRRRVLSIWNLVVPVAVALIVLIADAPSAMRPYCQAIACAKDNAPVTATEPPGLLLLYCPATPAAAANVGSTLPENNASGAPVDSADQCAETAASSVVRRLSWAYSFELAHLDLAMSDNLLLLSLAAVAQSGAVFLGILAIVLILRHNLFFVRNVYQRRWVSGDDARFFQIDPQDADRCFGFRIANAAFNAQVQALMIAGAAMLLSRYMLVTDNGGITGTWRDYLPNFPVPSQWMMALSWIVALGVVALPALVKLLPRSPGRGAERTELSIGNYLREFFSDQAWPKDSTGRDEPDRLVAARFAQNSFWPTGDNRARVLFFCAFWIFWFVLLMPPSIEPKVVAIGFLLLTGLAYLALRGLYFALDLSLRYVDERLVITDADIEIPPRMLSRTSNQEHDIGVFISYRRVDSAAYARSLKQELSAVFPPERVFMDITDIVPGENFKDKIQQALGSVDTVIVVLGNQWLALQDEHSRRRIDNPEDLVHIEIATALSLGKRVVPVLVGGAEMPATSALPEPLKVLSDLNAVELSDTRWAYDVGRLIDTLAASR